MEKLCWPMDVFARETNRSPQSAERSDRRDKSRDWADDLLEIDRISTSDTVEGQNSNIELYPHSDWQPVKSVTKHRCDVLVFADIRLYKWWHSVSSVAGV